MSGSPLHLFEGYGIELEYMIVDARTLDVRPICDRAIEAELGEIASDVERGEIAWSNELALHVIELKTNGPAASLDGLEALFHRELRHIDGHLASLGARLLGGAMHPWMDPDREMVLWQHDYSPVYEAFNRIFDCRGHGWANLQSMHINLPFANDAEFGRLHAAIRLVLPLLPALAASSPVFGGQATGTLDNRLEVYRTNARKIPRVAGSVVPEAVFTKAAYEQEILQPLYRDIAPHDPEGILQDEWLNARGAIARFDRDAIEIRVIDVQECPRADLAIAALCVHAVRELCDERFSSHAAQRRFETEPLAAQFRRVVVDGERAQISDPAYLAAFGLAPGSATTAGEVWRAIAERAGLLDLAPSHAWHEPLRTILDEGPLARRLLRALDGRSDRATLQRVWQQLAECLRENRPFHGPR
ncbi:MAG: glutamate--cysteine ligase [Planctomycetes bacterium]|nr:glutamate--cysteine ligase [Planctomycetota bacterium]